MESEDELMMHDAESLDDDFYSGDGGESEEVDVVMDYDFIDNESDDSDDLPAHHRSQVSFRSFIMSFMNLFFLAVVGFFF